MSNKAITWFLFVLTLLIFITYFLFQNIIFSSKKLMENELNNVVKYAITGDWIKAEDTVNKVVNNWNKYKYFLAINYAEADYSYLLDNLAKIQGAIKTKDATEVVTQSLSALKLWNNFKKVIPEP